MLAGGRAVDRGRGNLAALCGEQEGDIAKLPVQRMDNRRAEHAAAGRLRRSQEAPKMPPSSFKASCPAQIPQTPVRGSVRSERGSAPWSERI